MDADYLTPDPDLSLYHDYVDPVDGYESIGPAVTSSQRSRDSSQYERLPPGAAAAPPPSQYTALSTSATSSAPPAYQDAGPSSNSALVARVSIADDNNNK